ncbi:MAG TPA: hypothetical protein DCR44_02900 [Acholeplasmatales bacterium]|nr:MAG: hypothetical protein A2Y16_02045 [Tenericutes bacterium GWF2_57_13]HAQ56341.1 hypothetical protein [Acholeplasmatales bacterium]
MNEYSIAGIRLRLDYLYKDYFAGRIDAYRLPDRSPVDYWIETILTKDLHVPEGKPTLQYGKNMLFETKEETNLVILSADETYVKQIVTATKGMNHVQIKLNPEYRERLAEIEYIATGIVFFDIAANEGLLPLHASAIAHKGEAILFSAPSKTGKSTHANLWKLFAEDVRIINDDKPVISFKDDVLTVHGTPWAGKFVENDNVSRPLKAIVFLKQDKVPHIVELDDETRMKELFRNSYRPRQEDLSNKVIDVMDAILKKTDIFEFDTDISQTAFRMIYQRLYGGDTK